MKKNITLCTISLLLTFFSLRLNAQQVYSYHFLNDLTEQSGTGPDLNVLGTGAFINQSLPELSCLLRPVYNFDLNGGVSFDNAAAGNFITESYSIEMYFQYLSNTGFRRIIDYKNRTSDFGLYSTSTQLQFYDAITLNTTAFTASQYVHLVVTRDSATQVVNLFVDGVIAGSFVDVTGLGLLDNDNVLNFFQDDLVFGGEAQPGTISLLNIYDQPIDDIQVAANFAALKVTSSILTFETAASSLCAGTNIVDFTNTSVNTSATSYSWDFGDSGNATGTDATYTYPNAGNYTVTLVADDGLGCTDTATAEIEIFASPAISLGTDISLCDGDSVVLDAGAGFAGYLWSDSTTNQTLTVLTSGSYAVTVTDTNSCFSADTVEVNFTIPVQFNLGSDTTLCAGASVIISAPTGLAAYAWSTSDTTESITVSSSGIYAVAVTDSTGCASTDTIEVTVNPELIISLGADTAFCAGDTVVLDPGSFVSYVWSDLSVQPFLEVINTGIYAVTVTDSFGCVASDSIDITVNPIPVVDLGPDGFFCGGTTVTLDAGNPSSVYEWNDGTVSQTLDVTSPGFYAVTVTDANGCVGTDEIILGITPSFTLGADTILCGGNSLELDPGAGYAGYLWDDGSITQTITVTSSATYTVTITDSLGCVNADEIIVTFEQQPDVNLGNDINMCAGSSALLDAGPGFMDYLWNDNSTSQLNMVSQSGTYIVTVTNVAGCTDSDTIVVTVNNSPVVFLGNDTTICDGQQIILDAGPGFANYQWINGSNQQTITVNATNNYFVVVTDANGCSGSDDIDVIVNAPVPVPIITQNGNTLYSSAPSGNQWYSNPGGLIPGATDTSYSPPADGNYYCIVTDANGCESLPSDEFIFVIDGIADNSAIVFNVYPNPASDWITVNIESYDDAELLVLDVTGRIVKSIKIVTNSTRISTVELNAGSYLLKVLTRSGNGVQRMIISR